MDDYNKHLSEHLRLSLLRVLAGASGYSANDSVLTDAARSLGFTVPRDRVNTELAWLREQGLVETEEMESVVVAALTRRGQEVAEGHASVPGVRRPSARA